MDLAIMEGTKKVKREGMVFLLKFFSILVLSALSWFIYLIMIHLSGLDEWLGMFLSEPWLQLLLGVPGVLVVLAVFSFGMERFMNAESVTSDKEGEKEGHG
jgi:hypothetical protein